MISVLDNSRRLSINKIRKTTSTENCWWNYSPTAWQVTVYYYLNSRKLYLLVIKYVIFSINLNAWENISFVVLLKMEHWVQGDRCCYWGNWHIRCTYMWDVDFNVDDGGTFVQSLYAYWLSMCLWHYTPCNGLTLKYNIAQFKLRDSAACWYSN